MGGISTQVDRLLATAKRLETSFRTGHLTEAINERGLFGAMIDQVPDYLFAKDLQSRFLAVNSAVAQIHGMSAADLVGMSDFDLHPAETARQFFDIEQSVIQSGKPMIDMEEIVRDSMGAKKWLSTSKVPLKDSQGEIVGLIGISRDVTSRKHADLLREGQAKVLEMIASNVPLSEVLDRLVRLIEGQLDGVMGSILLLDEDGSHLLHGAAPSLPEAYCKAIHGVAIGPAVGSCGTAAYRRRSVIVADIMTDPLWTNFRDLAAKHGLRSCWSAPILSHLGVVLGTFAMYSSTIREPDTFELRLTEATTRIAAIAIERKRAADQIHFLAHHDALTGLPNRSLLKDRLTQAMLRTGPHNHVAVVFLDLDHFKTVNDSLGHTYGDELLKIMAGRMVACAGPTESVIRLGGDEFVILVAYQPDNHNVLSTFLDRVRAAIAAPVLIMGQAVHVTCSMGVATFPTDGTDAETLLMNADAAMYRAKEGGRDRFHFYTAEMNIRAHKRLALQEAMRNGIARGEFYLLYQPQIDLLTGRIFAVEALLRWDHLSLGLVPPSEFIPLAEETGLIVSLGDWVLCEACRQARAWQDAGLPPFNISVNVSARQFHERDWVASVKWALANNGLAPHHLELELTESLLLRDIDQAVVTMKELKAIGVQFAIDDFGTGYSSLSALKTLPVDRLKIDQSFIRNLADDDNDRGIAEAIITLGQRLHMRVIAEGVETERQMEILRESGCDEVQGFLLSRPISAAAIGELFNRDQ